MLEVVGNIGSSIDLISTVNRINYWKYWCEKSRSNERKRELITSSAGVLVVCHGKCSYNPVI